MLGLAVQGSVSMSCMSEASCVKIGIEETTKTLVDDFITSSGDIEDAYELTTNAKEILYAVEMTLWKWTTNSTEN